MYKLHLITEFQAGRLSAPMSPMMLAKGVAQQLNEKLFAIYRVDFPGNMFQEKDGPGCVTAYDHLLVCFPNWVLLVIDTGVSGRLVAACFGPDEEIDIRLSEEDKYISVPGAEDLRKLMYQGYEQAMEHKEVLNAQVIKFQTA